MPTLVERLREKSSSFFRIRDALGVKSKVYILTRVWPNAVGVGVPVDTVAQILPSPAIQNLEHRCLITPHGDSIVGDILLKGIAFDRYTEQTLNNTPLQPLTERYYLIDRKTYAVESIQQNYISWDVVLIKSNKELWRDDIIP